MDTRKLADYKKMMADEVRMRAYAQAIRKVCSGAVVCEIGVGLGPLSLMALQAGAKRVYGVELDQEALVGATRILAANGFGPDRFIPVMGLSTRVSLPERVDVVLSETLDSMGVGENTARYMADARERHLKPGGVFLPAKLDCHVALASPRSYRERRGFWEEHLLSEHGLDYREAAGWVKEIKHTLPVRTEELFSEWQLWQSVAFERPESWRDVSQFVLPVTREGVVDGFACAFDAELTAGVHIRTFPSDPSTHWLQAFNAFPSPIMARIGEAIYIELEISPSDHPSLQYVMRVASAPIEDAIGLMEARVEQLNQQGATSATSAEET
jgi:type I protein arginine methyltransferase